MNRAADEHLAPNPLVGQVLAACLGVSLGTWAEGTGHDNPDQEGVKG